MLFPLAAAGAVALLSLIGVFLYKDRKEMTAIHRSILPIAVGVFLGVVFFELIPETIELSHDRGPVAIMIGFLGFYALSHFLRTYHHHHNGHEEHDACVGTGARLLLIGDSVHNFADGIVIASAFSVSPALGIATTIGIALHEIPQEIAEFGVLIQSGFTKFKAALYNLISALSVVGGVLVATVFEAHFEIILGIAAGNLLYVAATDLIPELNRDHTDHFWQTFILTLFGVLSIAALLSLAH